MHVFTSVCSREQVTCVEAKGWRQMSFLIILNLLSWDKVSDLTLLFHLASLLWAFPVSTCWGLGSKVKHPACLALMWMLWIWSLSLILVWQGFFHWSVLPAPVFLLFMSTDLPSLSISILGKTLWTEMARLHMMLYPGHLCLLPPSAGPDFWWELGHSFCEVLSHWGCSVCLQWTVIFSPSRLFPSECSRHLQRTCYSPQASLLSAHGRKSKQVVWKKSHEEHIRPAYV